MGPTVRGAGCARATPALRLGHGTLPGGQKLEESVRVRPCRADASDSGDPHLPPAHREAMADEVRISSASFIRSAAMRATAPGSVSTRCRVPKSASPRSRESIWYHPPESRR